MMIEIKGKRVLVAEGEGDGNGAVNAPLVNVEDGIDLAHRVVQHTLVYHNKLSMIII